MTTLINPKIERPAKTTMKPSNAPTLQWTHELHEDYYVLNRGDVQVGILFPDTGMPVGYIRHFVATLNAYYPTEPGTRFPCGSTDTARAERAEAELAEQKWLKESAVKRAKELTEELAAERARLDYIDSLSPGDAWGIYRSSAQQNANLHAGDPRTLRKLPGIRAAIDAAMKEGKA